MYLYRRKQEKGAFNLIITKIKYTKEELDFFSIPYEEYDGMNGKGKKAYFKKFSEITTAALSRYIYSLSGNAETIISDIKDIISALTIEEFIDWQKVNSIYQDKETSDYQQYCFFVFTLIQDQLEAATFYRLPIEDRIVDVINAAAAEHFKKPDNFSFSLIPNQFTNPLNESRITITAAVTNGMTTTLYNNPGFRMMRQGTGINSFTLQATSKKTYAAVDAITGKATLEFKDIKVLIEEYSRHKPLTIPTMQLLDFMDIITTENGMKSPKVEFTIAEYMKHRGLSDKKAAREQINTAIEELKSISLEWEEKRGKKTIKYAFMNIADSGRIERGGKVVFIFGISFFEVLKSCSVMAYPDQLGRINSKRNPNSYNLLRKISVHKNMNVGKKNENILSVETLLSCATALPSYDEVMAGNRNVTERIIEPFQRDMNALAPTLQWEYCKKGSGEALTDSEIELNYYTFKSLNVRVKWNNYHQQRQGSPEYASISFIHNMITHRTYT